MKRSNVTVSYTLRKVLAQYEHEELVCTLSPEDGEMVDPAELMREARKTVVQATTAFLKKQQQQENTDVSND